MFYIILRNAENKPYAQVYLHFFLCGEGQGNYPFSFSARRLQIKSQNAQMSSVFPGSAPFFFSGRICAANPSS